MVQHHPDRMTIIIDDYFIYFFVEVAVLPYFKNMYVLARTTNKIKMKISIRLSHVKNYDDTV